MAENDDFYHSVSDGFTVAMQGLHNSSELCNQDSYEILTSTYGQDFTLADLKNASEISFNKIVSKLANNYGIESATFEDAKTAVKQALYQVSD